MTDRRESPPHTEDADTISKSERKRRMHHLQSLGEKLAQLNPGQLEDLGLSGALTDALAATGKIRKHEAKRRHFQFIGKLMRAEDETTIARIEQYLIRIQQSHAVNTDTLHTIENWRDRILGNANEEIENFLDEYPQADRQWLRQTVRQHQQESQNSRPPAAARKLFGYIRDCIKP